MKAGEQKKDIIHAFLGKKIPNQAQKSLSRKSINRWKKVL